MEFYGNGGKNMRKILQRAISFGIAGMMAWSAVPAAVLTSTAADVSLSDSESEINQYMDCFLPMPIIGELSEDCWGAAAVGARDQSNGLEDQDMSDYCYWDGGIIKDEETGKYYMFASRWAQNGGHWGSEQDGYLGWRGSQAIRAVSDNLYGPYVDEGPIWPDYYDGAGHNVFAFKLSEKDPVYGQYKYAISVSDVGRNGDAVNGTFHLSDSLTGEWTHIGKMNVDTNEFGLSNISIMVRPDGRYEATNRNGDLAIADSIEGPWEVVERKLWWKVPGMSHENVEDPVIWYSDGLYHCIANKWDTRYAYYLTSDDGIHNWTLHPGSAYTPGQEFLSYTDGTMNNWRKLERPNVYIEDGTLKAMTFAVIDVEKEEDYGNDMHGSKVLVVPFAGDKLGEFASRKDALERREGMLPAQDANVQSWQGEADKNYGGEAFLQLQGNTEQGLFGEGSRPYYDYDCKIGYLQYDLSAFDLQENGEDIDSAYLSLVYMKRAAGNASQDRIRVSLAESDWTEGSGREDTNGNRTDDGTLTWWNQPSLSYDAENMENTTAISGEFSLANEQREVTVDVTHLLKQFKQGESEGNILSFALADTAGNRIQIGSKEVGEKYAAKLSVYKKEQKEIAEVENVLVETTMGKIPQMPTEVAVTFTDGTKGTAKVKWDMIPDDEIASTGEVKVSGKLLGYDATTEAVVNVRYAEVESLLWDENFFFYVDRGEIPELPETVEAQLEDGNTRTFPIEWPELTEEMFQDAEVKEIVGTLTGSEGLRVKAKVIVDFNDAMKAPGAAGKVGTYRMSEDFAYVPDIDAKKKFNEIENIRQKSSMIYQWSEHLLVENCTGHNYGFQYGAYPEPNNANPEYLVIRAPYMTGFTIRGTAHNQDIANKNFRFEISSDGLEWTAFTDYEKTEDTSVEGWPSRLYTAEGLPEETHYLKIAFPTDETWGFNLNGIQITGGKEAGTAADVMEKIAAIGEVTLESEGAIAEARNAYDALTDEQKALVTNYGALEKAETDYAELKEAEEAQQENQKAAADVMEKIAAIGEVTLESKDAIAEARNAYDALTEEQKALVTNYEALEKAEKNYTELKQTEEVQDTALRTALADAKKTDLTAYTKESAEAFRKALTEAEAVLANPQATQAQIDEALNALQTAQAGLKKAEEPIKDTEIKVPAAGTVFQAGVLEYRITKSDAKNGTVAVSRLLKKQKSKITVPATVKKDGYTFKVTSINKQVFQKNKKLKSVVVGKNITSIGAKSFYGCAKLKVIRFLGTKAPKIGNRAFTGIRKNCKVTVPKKMSKKNLQKLKKGMKSAGKKVTYKKK